MQLIANFLPNQILRVFNPSNIGICDEVSVQSNNGNHDTGRDFCLVSTFFHVCKQAEDYKMIVNFIASRCWGYNGRP